MGAARVLLGVMIALLMLPTAAPAQSPTSPADDLRASPDLKQSQDLRQELKQKRYVVLPKPSPETVARDTEQALEELTAPDRAERLIRESRPQPPSRPDLDYSVVNGIQADGAMRALRR
jgi:hypothetical protein